MARSTLVWTTRDSAALRYAHHGGQQSCHTSASKEEEEEEEEEEATQEAEQETHEEKGKGPPESSGAAEKIRGSTESIQIICGYKNRAEKVLVSTIAVPTSGAHTSQDKPSKTSARYSRLPQECASIYRLGDDVSDCSALLFRGM
tara:strand:+ start:282 stop:716 length:435 start_codon:yes stop_codon:yes gene_type:complete